MPMRMAWRAVRRLVLAAAGALLLMVPLALAG
jgi:hypothetical protein